MVLIDQNQQVLSLCLPLTTNYEALQVHLQSNTTQQKLIRSEFHRLLPAVTFALPPLYAFRFNPPRCLGTNYRRRCVKAHAHSVPPRWTAHRVKNLRCQMDPISYDRGRVKKLPKHTQRHTLTGQSRVVAVSQHISSVSAASASGSEAMERAAVVLGVLFQPRA